VIQLGQGRVLTSTTVFALILAEIASLSVTIGCHRLFAHRTFKATPLLRNFLAVCNFFAGQNSIWLCLDKVDLSDLEQEPIVMFHKKYMVLIHVLIAPLTCGETDHMTHQLDQWKTNLFLLSLMVKAGTTTTMCFLGTTKHP
ncbi:unnamed protein product, partial [Allacma fusca]